MACDNCSLRLWVSFENAYELELVENLVDEKMSSPVLVVLDETVQDFCMHFVQNLLNSVE